MLIPASAVVPTRHRAQVLARTLNSMLAQQTLPSELIVVDASEDGETRKEVEAFSVKIGAGCRVRWLRADAAGAAVQRNQGVAAATQPVIWFLDDDIVLEPECVLRLWRALQSSPDIGGANAMITNQRYHPPGPASRCMFRLLGGKGPSFAGKILGPVVNLLPEDRADLPEVVPVEWLNTTCTMYRREALPDPPFPAHFTGYSLMEDVTLSLLVGRRWRLVNARTARILHDSQPGEHKSDPQAVARMQLLNRHYVMTQVLHRRGIIAWARLCLWELFGLVSSGLTRGGLKLFIPALKGRLSAILQIIRS